MSKFNWHARDSVSDNERDPNCPVVIQSSSASAASATTARCAVTVKLRESGSFVIAAGVLTEEDSEEFRAFVTEFHRTSNIRADAGLKYQKVIDVVDYVKGQNLTRLSLGTREN